MSGPFPLTMPIGQSLDHAPFKSPSWWRLCNLMCTTWLKKIKVSFIIVVLTVAHTMSDELRSELHLVRLSWLFRCFSPQFKLAFCFTMVWKPFNLLSVTFLQNVTESTLTMLPVLVIIGIKEAVVTVMWIVLSTCWMGTENKLAFQLLPKLFTKTL